MNTPQNLVHLLCMVIQNVISLTDNWPARNDEHTAILDQTIMHTFQLNVQKKNPEHSLLLKNSKWQPVSHNHSGYTIYSIHYHRFMCALQMILLESWVCVLDILCSMFIWWINMPWDVCNVIQAHQYIYITTIAAASGNASSFWFVISMIFVLILSAHKSTAIHVAIAFMEREGKLCTLLYCQPSQLKTSLSRHTGHCPW